MADLIDVNDAPNSNSKDLKSKVVSLWKILKNELTVPGGTLSICFDALLVSQD